jgi:hypothetical protein
MLYKGFEGKVREKEGMGVFYSIKGFLKNHDEIEGNGERNG